MKKVIVAEIIIAITILAIALPLALTTNFSYAGYQTINWNNASQALTFDLKKGQTVTGLFTFYGNERTDYIIYNPDIGEIIVSQTSEHQGNFTFTAKNDGQYYLRIHDENPFYHNMHYSYSISASPILGVDRVVLIGIVITIGIVSGLTIAIWNLRKTRIVARYRRI